MGFFDDEDDEEGQGQTPPEPTLSAVKPLNFDSTDEEDEGDAGLAPQATQSAPRLPLSDDDYKKALIQKLSSASDSSGVNDARQGAYLGNMLLAATQGLEGVARAKGMPYGAQGVNHAGYDSARQLLANNVKQAQDDRKARMDQVLSQDTLENQLDKRGFEKKKQGFELEKLQQDSDENKSDSQSSIARKNLLFGLFPELKDIPGIDKMSAYDILNGKAFIDTKENNDSKQQIGAAKTQAATDIADAKLKMAGELAQAKQDAAAAKAQAAATAKDVSRYDNLSNILRNGGRSDPDFKKNQDLITNSDKILTAGQQAFTQKNGPDKRQIEDIAIASAALQGGATGGAQATIKALVPHTYTSDAAGIMEWFLNKPMGTDQQEFVKRMLETAKREKHLADQNLTGKRADALNAYADLKDKLPDQYNGLYKRYIPNDASFDERGAYIPIPFKGEAESKSISNSPALPPKIVVGQTGTVQGRPVKFLDDKGNFEFTDKQAASK